MIRHWSLVIVAMTDEIICQHCKITKDVKYDTSVQDDALKALRASGNTTIIRAANHPTRRSQ
eukprot:scaffold97381_cov14-Prasinocladus_malaysianus.AAC.1